MNREQLKSYVESHPELISVKQSIAYPELSVLKYKKKVFYKNEWNRYTEICRGLVVDKDYNIIIRPFNKIYNFGIEKNSPVIEDSEVILAIRKVNGFMCAASKYKGELIVSTTGTLDSDYAKLARKWVEKSFSTSTMVNGHTYLFEVVDPSDPHIITEKPGLYFIGQQPNEYNSYMNYVAALNFFSEIDNIPHIPFNNFDGKEIYSHSGLVTLPQTITTLGELKKKVKSVNHEGYCFYTKDGRSAKIKSPYYLINKLFARKKDINDLFSANIKIRIDEEYWTLVDHLKENKDHFNSLDEQQRLNYIREYIHGTYIN